MFKRFIGEFAGIVVFLGLLFGLLYFLLIVADRGPIFTNMKFFFWTLLPLVIFALLFGLVESVRKVYFRKS
jgi:hypothetical protein